MGLVERSGKRGRRGERCSVSHYICYRGGTGGVPDKYSALKVPRQCLLILLVGACRREKRSVVLLKQHVSGENFRLYTVLHFYCFSKDTVKRPDGLRYEMYGKGRKEQKVWKPWRYQRHYPTLNCNGPFMLANIQWIIKATISIVVLTCADAFRVGRQHRFACSMSSHNTLQPLSTRAVETIGSATWLILHSSTNPATSTWVPDGAPTGAVALT
jgi:hypothetical protein